MNQIYKNNLNVIKKNHTNLEEHLKYKYNSERFRKENISEHLINIYDNKYKLFYHKNLAAEMKELLNYDFEKTHLFVIIGIGSGYYLKFLLQKYPFKHFVIIEKDQEYFNYFIHEFNYSEIFKKRNTLFLINEKPEEISRKIEQHYKLLMYTNLQLIENKEKIRIYPEYYDKIKKNLNILVDTSKKNYLTLEKFSDEWEKNIFDNLGNYIMYNDISKINNIFLKQPGLLVGAGPSLDNNLKIIKDNQNKFIIISMDTAVRSLINNDITPDIVVSIDSQKINYTYLVNLNFERSFLTAPPLIMKNTFKLFKNNIFVFNYGHPLLNYIDSVINKSGKTAILGSVSCSALDISVQLGCSPIILIGCDFGFEKMDSHAGAAMEDKLLNIQINKFLTYETLICSDNNDIVEVEGNIEKVKSTNDLLNWKKWFEEQIENEKIRRKRFNESNLEFINCSDTGAKLKGVQFQFLKDACKGLKHLKLNKYQKLKQFAEPSATGNIILELKKEIINFLNDLEKKLKIIEKRIVDCDETKTEYYLNRLNNYLLEIILDKSIKNILEWDIKKFLYKNNYILNEKLVSDLIKISKKTICNY